jgi:hypothetical protein
MRCLTVLVLLERKAELCSVRVRFDLQPCAQPFCMMRRKAVSQTAVVK